MFTLDGQVIDEFSLEHDPSTFHALLGADLDANLAVRVGQEPFRYKPALQAQLVRYFDGTGYSSQLQENDLALECILSGIAPPDTLDTRLDAEFIYRRLLTRLETHAPSTGYRVEIERMVQSHGNAFISLSNSKLVRHAASLEHWDVVETCIPYSDISFNGYEAGMIAACSLPPSNALIDLLLPPQAWNVDSILAQVHAVIYKKNESWIRDTRSEINQRLSSLASHLSSETIASLISALSSTDTKTLIKYNAVEWMDLVCTHQQVTQSFLNAWLVTAHTHGCIEIAALLTGNGAEFSGSPYSLVAPPDTRTVMIEEDCVEFHGRDAMCVSFTPISTWSPSSPAYIELYIAEVSDTCTLSLGVTCCDDKGFGLACFRYFIRSVSDGRVRSGEIDVLLMKGWSVGDSVGCVVDARSGGVLYTLNGKPMGDAFNVQAGKEWRVGVGGRGGYARVLVNVERES